MRILLIRTSALGDVVHCLPVLTALRRHLPEARIGWVVEKTMAPLLAGHPDLDDLIEVELRPWRRRPFSRGTLGGVARFLGELEGFSPDLVIDLMGNHKAGVLGALTFADRRIGARARDRRERSSACWISEPVSLRGHHVVDRALSLLDPLGLPQEAADFGAEKLFVDAPAPSGLPERFFVVHPGAAWPNKRYPAPLWGEVARRLRTSTDLPGFVVHGPGEADLAQVAAAHQRRRPRSPRDHGLGVTRRGAATGRARSRCRHRSDPPGESTRPTGADGHGPDRSTDSRALPIPVGGRLASAAVQLLSSSFRRDQGLSQPASCRARLEPRRSASRRVIRLLDPFFRRAAKLLLAQQVADTSEAWGSRRICPRDGVMGERLGELLVKAERITPEQLDMGLQNQRTNGGRIGSSLVDLGFIDDMDLVEFLSIHHGVPSINLDEIELDEAVVNLIPSDITRKYTILPVSKSGAKVTIAMADPTNVFAMDDIKFMTGYDVEPVVASESSLKASIDRYYGSTHAIELKKVMQDLTAEEAADLELLEDDEDIDLEALEQEAEEAPVVRLVNIILTDAIKRGRLRHPHRAL